MKKYINILTGLLLISQGTIVAQEINNSQIEKYCGEKKNCGPYDMVDKVTRVIGDQTDKAPFRQILHIQTDRWNLSGDPDYGTVSFISPNTLITARHVVSGGIRLRHIHLSAPSGGKDVWIELDRKDFKVFPYPGGADLAVVKIRNSAILSRLYRGSTFVPAKLNEQSMKAATLNLTGYPCYFANTPGEHDTLINKTVAVAELKANDNFLAYRIFTCVGDSGGPLWLEQGAKFFVIGIHHGGPEDQNFPEDYNMSVRLDDKMIKWLQEISSK